MKRFNLLGFACTVFLVLVGCTSNFDYFNAQIRHDLSRETWLRNVNLDPNRWTKNADSWFFTGQPNQVERYGSRAPYAAAITTMSVRVPNFTNLRVDGPFRVQIVGGQERNSVFVFGPNQATRQVAIDVHGNTLFVHPAKDASGNGMRSLIVRIGVRNLRSLVANGSTYVEGKQIMSDCLTIVATNCGHVLLAGSMNLTSVQQMGGGSVSVIGAYTPMLNIKVMGPGAVNASGRVGIRSIDNRGGKVSIIGADSDQLTIYASGSGVTSIAGYANVRKISAFNNSRVYVYWVNSYAAYIYQYDNAQIGLAGLAKNLNIELAGSSRYDGQYLRGGNVYVRTRNYSHANVSADKKLFAAALDNSSIYFFGSPNVVSRYNSGNGVVIPVWGDACPVLPLPPPTPITWKNTKGEMTYKDERPVYK